MTTRLWGSTYNNATILIAINDRYHMRELKLPLGVMTDAELGFWIAAWLFGELRALGEREEGAR